MMQPMFRIDPMTGGNTVVSSGGLLSASLRDVEVGADGTVYVGLGNGDIEGRFQQHVAHVVGRLRAAGLVRDREGGAIVNAAARSGVGR